MRSNKKPDRQKQEYVPSGPWAMIFHMETGPEKTDSITPMVRCNGPTQSNSGVRDIPDRPLALWIRRIQSVAPLRLTPKSVKSFTRLEPSPHALLP